MTTLAQLRQLGFTESESIPFTKQYRVRCDSCSATVVNGHPLHERGCPNDKHECAGCYAIISANRKYCEDCQ